MYDVRDLIIGLTHVYINSVVTARLMSTVGVEAYFRDKYDTPMDMITRYTYSCGYLFNKPSSSYMDGKKSSLGTLYSGERDTTLASLGTVERCSGERLFDQEGRV